MNQAADDITTPEETVYPAEAASSSVVSIIIPVILGCAVMGVAVFMAYSFASQQEEVNEREQAEKARAALKESLEAMKRQDYQGAESAADRALQLAEGISSESGVTDVELMATAYLFRGESRAGLGSTEKLKGSVADYTHCLEYNSSDEDRFLAYYGRGQVQFRLGHTREAEQDFTSALEINKYSAAVHRARAFARRRLLDLEGAAADSKRADELGDSGSVARP